MYRPVELPANVPAQVRSWNMDYQKEVEKYNKMQEKGVGPAVLLSQASRVEAAGTKVTRYLMVVKANGGKIIPPPITKAEQDVANSRRNRTIAGSKLEYRSNY